MSGTSRGAHKARGTWELRCHPTRMDTSAQPGRGIGPLHQSLDAEDRARLDGNAGPRAALRSPTARGIRDAVVTCATGVGRCDIAFGNAGADARGWVGVVG